MYNLMLLLIAVALFFSPETKHVAAAGSPSQTSLAQAPQGSVQSQPSLDYKTYRIRIEPIFLKKRQDGVRCYDCHSVLSTRLRLQPLPTGSSSWAEEQSRRNFEAVSQLVTPCAPMKSRLLLHPLASEAGGDPMHTGGKFWTSQSDPEWQMIADWVGKCSGKQPDVAANSSSLSPGKPTIKSDENAISWRASRKRSMMRR